MVHLKLDPASPIPIYLQIVEQIRRGIAAGLLEAEEELPSVRALASRHIINPNTVARAYLELEREGLLSKKRGTGTFVSAQAVGLSQGHRTRILEDLIDKAVAAADEFGFPADEIRSLFERRLKQVRRKRAATETEI
jgi:GntR family transcriptional regulator